MNPFDTGLTDAERERLACLVEECGEVQQIVGKIIKHGYKSHHPDGGPDNRELLARKIGDVFVIYELMADLGDVCMKSVNSHADAKAVKISDGQAYMHFQKF